MFVTGVVGLVLAPRAGAADARGSNLQSEKGAARPEHCDAEVPIPCGRRGSPATADFFRNHSSLVPGAGYGYSWRNHHRDKSRRLRILAANMASDNSSGLYVSSLRCSGRYLHCKLEVAVAQAGAPEAPG